MFRSEDLAKHEPVQTFPTAPVLRLNLEPPLDLEEAF